METATFPEETSVLRFSVLGTVRLWQAGVELEVGPRKRQLILALLLVRAGRPVAIAEFVDLLWPNEPPTSAINVIHRHIGELRRMLEPELLPRSAGRWLRGQGTRYRLVLSESELDLLQFRWLANAARAAAEHGDVDTALHGYADALSLWAGPCGHGLTEVVGLHPAFTAVDHEVTAVVREAADLAIGREQGDSIASALRQALQLNPFDEGLHARLIRFLMASGSRAEAVAAYRSVSQRLQVELGVEPGAELTAVYEELRQQRSATPGPPGGAALPVASADESQEPGAPAQPGEEPFVVQPAQLPPDLPVFVGRANELARLVAIATDPAARQQALTIAITGMPGVGKSTFAVHLAHRIVARFPDGQIFMNLRGFDTHGAVMGKAEALRVLLVALGVPESSVPATPDARTGLYRSLMAKRRMLVLLDNARDADQVADLIANGFGSLTIITSRTQLTGIAIRGSRMLTLDVPSVADAREAVAVRIGRERTDAELVALDDIVARCARLPLALAVVSARIASNPHFALSAIAAGLRRSKQSLSAFATGDVRTDVRSVFSWSYRLLSRSAARMLRLLSLHAGPDISLAVAASLAGVPRRKAGELLAELTENRLLNEHRPGRFVFHDLLRDYAVELARELQPDVERRAALARLVDYHTQTLHVAYPLLDPVEAPIEAAQPRQGTVVEDISTVDEAVEWFLAERDGLMALLDHATEDDLPETTWKLSFMLIPYFQRLGLYAEWLATMQKTLSAATAAGETVDSARAHRNLAGGSFYLGDTGRARYHLDRAEELFRRAGQAMQAAQVERNRGMICLNEGDYQTALEHFQHCAEVFRTLGDVRAQGDSLIGIATCWLHLGRAADAVPLTYEAIALYEAAGLTKQFSWCWSVLAEAAYLMGNFAQSVQMRQQALHYTRLCHDKVREAIELDSMATVHLELGDAALALEYWREALKLAEEHNAPNTLWLREILDGQAEADPLTGERP